MSFNDKYLKLRKERLGVGNEKNTSFDEEYAKIKAQYFDEEEDIAPVRELTHDDAKKAAKKMMGKEEEEEDEDDRKWFQKGAFEDGYQFGDITKTIFGSDSDLAINVTAGILGIGEKVVDTGATIVGGVAGLFGNDKVKDKMADFAEKDLYDEHKVAEKMNSVTPNAIIRKLLGVDAEEDSVFGEKTDDLAYSGGQLVGTVGLQSVGVPWYVTTGATSFGGAMEGALKEGATFEEAAASSAISAGAEILSEKLFGGSGLGETGLINLDGLTKGISNKLVKALADYGVDIAAEGFEEIFSQFAGNFASSLYKEDDLKDLLFSEEAIDGYIESFIGGGVLGGGMNVGNVTSSIQSGKDYRSGLTANEEAVVNKVYEDRIAEAEENGETLTAKEKDKIHEEVVDDLNMGFISIEDIEGALGGDTYMEYKNTLDEESELQREFDELGNLKKSEFTAKQDDRYNELKQKLAEIKESGKSAQLKAKLGEDVFGLAKGSLLENSYNERANRGRAFDADLNQYDAKQQEIVKKAIDSGILNNSNRTHQFVDIVAKISADKGVSFDFVNNAKLKESGFALDGKVVNGFVTKDGISINIDSPKAWQSTVGHEITHVLEGTELYGELQTSLLEYAETKGDLQGRREALAALYDGVEGADVDAELTADLVGDYLFTDSDFINNLSTQHRNVFQKVYDEIKYLAKVVTAGSKEARQLEKVRHAFEKAYRESGEVGGDTKYSLSDQIKSVANERPTGDPDIRFSLSGAVEETKDLMALHNLHTDEVLKQLEMGGIPYPSVAVTKPDLISHEGFGEVTLILPKETIDPKTSKYNKIYSADAYTPTFPKISYEASMDVADRISNKVIELYERVPEYYRRSLASLRDYTNINERLNSNRGERGMITDYSYDYGLKQLYLADIGEAVPVVTSRTEKQMTDTQKEQYQSIVDRLGTDAVNSLADKGWHRTVADARRAWLEEHGEALKDAYAEYWSGDGLVTKAEALEIANGESDLYWFRELRQLLEYAQTGGTTIEVKEDYNATDVKIDEKIDESAYKKWLGELFGGIEGRSGLRNDKDMFTPSGNRRSFSQLHDPITIDNVIKAMRKKEQKGEGAFGTSNINGASARQYGSISEVKADSSRLGKMEQAEHDAIQREITDRLYDIAIRYANGKDTIDAKNTLVEAVAKYESKEDIARYLKQFDYVYKHTDDIVNDLIELRDYIRTLSTPYFEAKPRRAVGFDEVGVFVIPRNADVKLKQELLNRGYAIAEYDPDVVGDRQKVVNSFEEYKFSLSDANETPKRYGSFATPARDLRYEAPVREDVAPVQDSVQDVQDTVQNVNDTVQDDDFAPVTEDMANAMQDENMASLTDADVPPVMEEPSLVENRPMTKLESIQVELAKNMENSNKAFAGYNQKIAKLQAEYDAKKKKDTKVANDLLMKIERIKRIRDSVDAKYAKRISNLETKEKLVREGKPTTRQELHIGIIGNLKSRFADKGYDLDKVLKGAKDLSTFATVDNTPQRVMEKALGYKEGQILADETVNQVAYNETEGIKWLNSFTDRKNGLLAKISRKYNIKPGSKESAAAQMYAEGFYVDENNDIVAYGDAELAADFPDPDVQKNIKGLAGDKRIRQIYDDTLAMINASRERNAYPEIPRLDNYFLHFRAMDDTFSRLGLPFNPNDIRAKDLPTDLNGVTADLKPGQPYFASAKHRTGQRTSFDLLGGLERYLTSAKNQIYHIDDIQTLRALRNYIADIYGQANGLDGLDALSEDEAQERIKQVYGSHLSTFAKFLNEEANVLAGKTALIDRGLEGIIGRRGITFLDSLNKQVGSNMVGYNLSSALTNFIPVVQTFAKGNKAAFVKALGQTGLSILGRNDGFAEQSPVMIRRKGADRFHRTAWQKIADPGYALMGLVDGISTELIARTKYNELTHKGMDSQKAHFETDKWVSRMMGDRSLGQMPQLYNSKMLGLFTKFQLEVRNQLDSQFYDTVQETKVSNEHIEKELARNAKTAAKVASVFVQLAVLQHGFGKLFENVAGYNPAFDIIEVLIKTFGFDDDEDDEDTVVDNLWEGANALLEDLPYTSTLTGGGRIPISSALPIKEFLTGKDDYGNEKSRLETLGEVAPYYLMPGGYGQAKKTIQGLGMFSDDHPVSGSYTDSGNLRFPVEDTLGNKVKAGIFGQWASENARDYFDNERKPLEEKQIQEYIDVELPIADYWNYREGLSGLKTLAEKADYINSLDLEPWQKNLLINNIADRKEPIDMTEYGEYESFEEFDFAQKDPAKYNFLKQSGVSYEDYKAMDEDAKDAYSWAFNNPDKRSIVKAVTGDVVEYRKYTGDLYDIKADKDEDGKTINGSAKEKKKEYIFGLDLDYGQKIILYRSLYDSKEDKNTYNADIVQYLDNRDDISLEEMKTILEELGMKMDANGWVTWD